MISASFQRTLPCFCAALMVFSGCGYVSEPLPPLLNIPGRGENVTALQRGATIIVHFTLPTLTTEGRTLKQSLKLDLRIGPKGPGAFNGNAWAGGAKPVGGGKTANGVAEFKVPAAEWTGKHVAVAVRIVGANGRDAGWSNAAELEVVAAPEQPRDLAAQAVPQGVRLTWQGNGAAFAVLRRGPDEQSYSVVGRATKPEYIDTTVQFGKTYSYEVQSLVKSGTSEAESDFSAEATITPLDTFPPAAPIGLTAVPSTASIELVWEHSPEAKVVGYRVYRALGSGPMELIADKVVLPAYSDRKFESGKSYRYAVTAVKSNQVESQKSEPVEITAP